MHSLFSRIIQVDQEGAHILLNLQVSCWKDEEQRELKESSKEMRHQTCLEISLVEARARFKVCKDKCNYFRKNGHKYRTRHLKNRLQVAKNKGDTEDESRILVIISVEK